MNDASVRFRFEATIATPTTDRHGIPITVTHNVRVRLYVHDTGAGERGWRYSGAYWLTEAAWREFRGWVESNGAEVVETRQEPPQLTRMSPEAAIAEEASTTPHPCRLESPLYLKLERLKRRGKG